MKYKILFYDLETAPLISYNWGIYEQNAIAVKKEWELLSVAYKWLGSDTVVSIDRRNMKTDKQLISDFLKVLKNADVVVAHNGIGFDNKKLAARMIKHGFSPPKPFKSVDTLREARKRFAFTSNKLNDLGVFLKVGKKANAGGFDTWLGCMKNNTAAWDKLTKYNRQDVRLLERVYKKLRPWMTSHPEASGKGCPKCGSNKAISNGFRMASTGVYRRLQCLGCGGWYREAKRAAKFISKYRSE